MSELYGIELEFLGAGPLELLVGDGGVVRATAPAESNPGSVVIEQELAGFEGVVRAARTLTVDLDLTKPVAFISTLSESLGLPTRQILAGLAAKADALTSKVGGDLANLFRNGVVHDWVQTFGNTVIIEAAANGDAGNLQAALEKLGLQEASSFNNMVSGFLPVSAIGKLAEIEDLQFARPAYRPITHVGDTTSQGDAALQADVVRANSPFDGSGVKVGVLSDSYDRTLFSNISAADDILSGDLPGTNNPNGYTTPVDVLRDVSFLQATLLQVADEGRGMLQLIHDVAPGAELAFRTAFLGAVDFANGIGALVDAGSDVIVDDIGYLTQPFFQDGIIAQAADDAFAAGVPYFSAAGNSGRQSYESEFRPVSIPRTSQYVVHDFDPGPGVDPTQDFTLAQGGSLTISFQWDQPFLSAGGVGSASDLDIFVLDANNNVVGSAQDNNIGGDAVEFFSFTNNTGSTALKLAIGQDVTAGGPTANYIKYIEFDERINNVQYGLGAPTSFGHPVAANALAVGAAFYAETPEFGVNPAELEDFSSAGGTPIFFNAAGVRLASPEVRQKVDIVAPDGTNTTFFPPFPGADADGDGFNNFFGTSAAAPHAAAVAALLLDAAPTTSAAEIYDVLERTALDMDDPSTPGFDTGFDFASGNGFIQADLAILDLLNLAVPAA